MDEPTEGAGMDPVIGGAAKVGAAAAKGLASSVGGLLERVFGPLADEYGAELVERHNERRARNAERVIAIAERKSRAQGDGQIPPRVGFRLLEESTLADDELMAEYLGGLLAGSRSPDGRDDRAVVWSALLGSMSTLQLRAHFVLYRAWAEVLRGRDLNLWVREDAVKARLFAEVSPLVDTLLAGDQTDRTTVLAHVLPGLRRAELVGGDIAWGSRDHVSFKESSYDWLAAVTPTGLGVELYGWAAGHPGFTVRDFLQVDVEWTDPSLPRLELFEVPGIDEVERR